MVRQGLRLIPNAFNGQPKIYMSNSFQKAWIGEESLFKLLHTHENILLILVLVSKNKMTGSNSEVQSRITQSLQPLMTFK